MRILSPKQVKKINKVALAEKHACSPEYVGQLLHGKKTVSTDKAASIVNDSLALLEILEAKPSYETKSA